MPINADNGQNNQNDDQNEQNGQQNNPVTLAGSGKAQPNTSGRVAGFSSGQPQQTGSGRFTNLSKYMSANQGAGERIGSQIQNQVNRNVDTKTSNISEQNQKVRQGIEQGRAQLNQGNQFNEQLTGINKGLSSFNNMEDRAGFDAASQQAQQFTQAPNFNQFQNIQAGQGVDENALNQGQGQAQVAGQDLSKLTGDNINRIGTEQGRYELLRNRFAPGGRSYAAGNARLDQALLQNAPGNVIGQMRNQFVDQNQASSVLNNQIGAQGQDVNKTVADEVSLLSNLDTVTKSNQDIFNEKLGQKGNIDYIQDLRKKKYDEYLKQLQTGNIGQEVSNELGLNDLYTYQPGGLGINPVSVSSKMSREQIPGANRDMSGDPRSIVGYNTDLAKNAQNYLKQGQVAQKYQDIVTDDDYAGYQALANIAKRDTGKLSGASQLDKAVQATKNSNGQSLADVISGQDKTFKDTLGGRNFSTYNTTNLGNDDYGNRFERGLGNILNVLPNTLSGIGNGMVTGDFSGLVNPALTLGGGALTAGVGAPIGLAGGGLASVVGEDVMADNKQRIGSNNLSTDFAKQLNLDSLKNDANVGNLSVNDLSGLTQKYIDQTYTTHGGQGTGTSSVNLDDYIKNGAGSINSYGGKTGKNLNASDSQSKRATAAAIDNSKNTLTSALDKIIAETGVKNKLNINQDDSKNEVLNKSKRYSRLV